MCTGPDGWELCRASTARPRSNVITVADCYRVAGRGEDRENAGVKHAEVVTGQLVQDDRGWLRIGRVESAGELRGHR